MTGDVTLRCVRCLQARGRGRSKRGRAVRRGEGGRLIIAGGCRTWRRGSWAALEAHGIHDPVGIGPEGLHLDVWFVPPSPRYAARNFSIEKTVWRASM